MLVHVLAFFRSQVSDFRTEVSDFLQMLTAYRPERHYMRGPGPKWHAKQATQAQGKTRIDGADAAISPQSLRVSL